MNPDKKPPKKKRLGLRMFSLLFSLFFTANVMSFMHAYKFTHFTKGATKLSSADITMAQAAKALILGADVPRPENNIRPEVDFEEVIFENENGKLHSWWMEKDSANPSIALFHGYGAAKSSILPYAYAFLDMGFNVFMMDTSGSGDSEGNTCTIGVKEALDARTAFDYLKEKNKGKDIYLFGESMGAATILRSISHEGVKPKAIIIQCPFESMLTATKSRFENMGVPFWGLGHMLVFWGGIQNGFNAFGHSPKEYAKSVDMPSLLIWGARDDLVRKSETDAVYENLGGEKELVVLENVGHSGHILFEPTQWKATVRDFINRVQD